MQPQPQQKPQSRRKLIAKVHKKNKKRMQNWAKSHQSIQKVGSALGKMMNEHQAQQDFDLINQITMGQNRKMKKKMKKLKKRIVGDDANDKIFKEMQKYKTSIIKTQERTIFNPINQMKKRREKRMKRMEQNTKNMKKEVLQKLSKM